MTDDLVQWLHAQLDEDQRIAEAARDQSSAQWHHDTSYDNGYVYDENSQAVVYDEGTPAHEEAEHIAAHDPARVLREIEAKRRLLDDYTVTARIRDEAAERIKATVDHPDSKDLETWDRAQQEAAILEGPVRLAALPFNNQPNYREEWRP